MSDPEPAPSTAAATLGQPQRGLAAIENEVTVGLFSGLRLGEILASRWSDVSIESRQRAVSHFLQKLGQLPARLVEVKSTTSHRTVPLLGPALAALESEWTLRDAGLEQLRFHDLRHAYAGRVLASGEELAAVSHLLGHGSLNLTLNTSCGVAPELKRAAAERFERLLGKPCHRAAAFHDSESNQIMLVSR